MKAILLVLALASSNASAADRMCQEVNSFHFAKFDKSVDPKGYRWVELHWVGTWMDVDHGFGFECRHSPDAASVQLCSWLTRSTSFEFPPIAPKEILTCYGYHFPAGSMWRNWTSDIDIWTDDRLLKLQIDFATAGAIRLSSFAKDQFDGGDLPPLSSIPEKQ